MAQLFNKSKSILLAHNLEEAKSFLERSKGLLGRSSLQKDTCLWIHKCSSVHTFFMKFNIDVLYVDKNLKVVKIERDLEPWKISWGGFRARSCFEFGAKTLPLEIDTGDFLNVSI